jgi:uncharacterized membrane protein
VFDVVGGMNLPTVLSLAACLIALTLWTYAGWRRAAEIFLFILAAAVLLGAPIHFLTQYYDRFTGSSGSVLGSIRFMLWPGIAAGCMLFLIAALLWLVRRTPVQPSPHAKITSRRLGILLTLRLLGLAIAILSMIRPTWYYRTEERQPGVIALLIDHSKSMLFKDEHHFTRWYAAQREWNGVQDEILKLQENNIRVVPYLFHDRLRPFNLEEEPTGQKTGLFRAVEESYKIHANVTHERLLAIVALSDGRDNVLSPKLENLGDLCPVYTVALGRTENQCVLADVNVESIEDPQGVVKTKKLYDREIEVWLYLNDEPVAMADRPDRLVSAKIQLPRQPQRNDDEELTHRVKLPAFKVPDTTQDIKLTLRVEPIRDELTFTNNQVSTYVSVTKEGISVLYIDRLRAWEPREIAKALKGDNRITLYTDFSYRHADAAEWRKRLIDNLKKNTHEVFILGDIPAHQLGTDILKEIRRMVDRQGGSGLLMIGGHETFQAGGWDKSLFVSSERGFDNLLPVDLSVGGQIEGVGRKDDEADKEIKFHPTRDALRHFIFQLGLEAEAASERWGKLRSLTGGSRLGNLTRQSDKLVTTSADGKGDILLAVRDQSRGRTAALAVDTTWRWLQPDERPGRKPDAREVGQVLHVTFWRNLIIWLARQEAGSQALRLELARRRMETGSKQHVDIEAFELLASGKRDVRKPIKLKAGSSTELRQGEVRAKLILPNKTEKNLVLTGTEEDGSKLRGGLSTADTEAEGEYEIVVHAMLGGREEVSRARFVTYSTDEEMSNRSANHVDLEKLSAKTGGVCKKHGDLEDILKQIQALDQSKNEGMYKFPEWDKLKPSPLLYTSLFLVFVACLAGEWVLRRVWGLV